MIRLAAAMCMELGQDMYLASMLVIVEMSGRVEILSQFKLPINVCIIWVTLDWFGDGDFFGIVSTGWPLLYGVLTEFVASESRPDVFRR